MDQVEEIKSKVDIVELIQEYMPLKRAGRNFKGLCPFHGEKTPSFMVNPELQIFKCFGCGAGGDVYSFLQKIEGLEFGEALQNLAKRTGVTLVSYKSSQVEELKDKLLQINDLAANYYHFLLTKHPLGQEALAYLTQRGITGESVAKFNLGYAPDGWDYLLKYLVGKKNIQLGDIQRVGLAVEAQKYDRFRNRIMFPLANHRGQVVGFAGRVLPGADEKSGGKYVNTPETEIYHKGEMLYGLDIARVDIKSSSKAVIVEGELDAIASWQAGVKNVVAIKGSALTEKQVEYLRRICETAILALDTDLAGDTAARRGIEIAEKGGLTVKVAQLGQAKDPGELAITSPDTWRQLVETAIPIYDFYIESAVSRWGLDVGGKKKIGQELLPILGRIDDQIIKAHYLKKLADLLQVGEEDVRAQLAKVGSKTSPDQSTSADSARPLAEATRREMIEAYVLGILLHEKKFAELPKIEPWIKSSFWKKVVDSLKQQPSVASLPAELKGRIEELFLSDQMLEEREWDKALRRLEEIDVREAINNLRDGSDPKRLQQLSKRLGDLTRQTQ